MTDLNLLTDVAGLRVGHATDHRLRSGVTAILFEQPAVAAVSILGGAPAVRETALLELGMAVERIDAVVLSGGSTYGLDATAGVQAWFRQRWRETPPERQVAVPIVVQASLFDLGNGGDKAWQLLSPYTGLGHDAAASARDGGFALGSVGAGTGATTATVKGGLGSASMRAESGHAVAAIVAVNAVGSVTVGDGPHFWAAAFERQAEFGGLGAVARPSSGDLRLRLKPPTGLRGGGSGTVIGLVATDASLTPTLAQRLAIAGQDGLARAVLPAHLPRDGDTVFAAGTGRLALGDPFEDISGLCHAATLTMARAIARGVWAASSRDAADGQPSWQDRFGDGAASGATA